MANWPVSAKKKDANTITGRSRGRLVREVPYMVNIWFEFWLYVFTKENSI